MNTPAPLDAQLAEERVLGWQNKLHRWAVQDDQVRFGDLFNLICDPATLLVAWERVKRNRGSKTAGVDGITRKHIEQAGVEKVLGELRQSLRDRTYTPLPVREHQIPKRGSGKVRKLGIPALRDRIVQMATELVLEPIFEAGFCPTSYGFRPGRRTQDAIEEVRFFINDPRTYEWVIEGDVENCFGSIHHGLLLAELRRRVTDKRVLALIRQFLRAGIMTHLGTLTDTPSGTPQGAILSPLLSNIALSVCQWPSVSPQVRPSVLPTGGHLFSPLVAMSSPHDRVGERPSSRGPSREGEAPRRWSLKVRLRSGASPPCRRSPGRVGSCRCRR